MTDLIRWEPNRTDGLLGYAGTLADPWVFQIFRNDGRWMLMSQLPGDHSRHRADDCDELKARAEELLREFAASIGAVFPEPGPGGYVTAYPGSRSCRYCTAPARWDIAGLLACPDLDHVERALEDLTASKES